MRTAPATILLVAIWIGLTAGFLDLGLMILKKRLTGDAFYRLGDHFSLDHPGGGLRPRAGAGDGARSDRLLAPRTASPGHRRGTAVFRRIPRRVCHGCRWNSGLRCCCRAGLAVQIRPAGRPPAVSRSSASCAVRAPLLVGAVLAIMLLTFGGRAWSEYRASAALPPAPADARNVLLIVWDTVRAGNLSLHGYGRRTSPNLERLAGRGVRFDQAFATAPWTLPSHSSLFTGRWPHELTADWRSPLDETYPTLAEYLAAHGYDTAGFVANLDYCSRETGLSRGFAHYEDYPIELVGCLHALHRHRQQDRLAHAGLRDQPAAEEVLGRHV